MDTSRDFLLARDLVDDGYSHTELAAQVRRGDLTRLRRGAYLSAPVTDVDHAYRLLVRSTVARLDPAPVLSHWSAAALHRLPLPVARPTMVQITRPGAGSGRRHGHLHRFTAALDPAEVVEVDGLEVTSLARTVVDLGRFAPFPDAVAAADAALRAGLSTDDLGAALAAAEGRRGTSAARRVAGFADGRAESPGESHSRVLLHELGLDPTDLQLVVSDADGRFVGRADFAWQDRRTLGEFDGLGKYRSAGDAAGSVLGEKWREDALRTAGWEVVRWTWADLARPLLVRRRLEQAFVRGTR